MAVQTYLLTGLHCSSCVSKITTALTPFADSVEVSLKPPQAVLSNPRVGLLNLQTAVADAGAYMLLAPPPPQSIATTIAHTAGTDADRISPVSWWVTYQPLLLLLVYILAASMGVQIATGSVTAVEAMRLFMAGFFLAFSFFKLLDIRAFAEAYAGYDLLAARWKPWGLIYPFVELALGLAYLTNWQPLLTNSITLAVMAFSAIGVVQAVLDKRKIQCACLGAVFNLPMSTVTIIEDVGMALMAALMLWHVS